MSKRVLAHEIDDLAKSIFIYKKPNNWVVNEIHNDYGIDYQVEVFDSDGESTSIIFYVQLKGQESINIDNNKIKFVFKTERLKDYVTKNVLPVFLILVDVTNKKIFWLFLQKYVNEILNENKPNWVNQKNVTIYLPKNNIFVKDIKIIEKTAENGIKYCNHLINGLPSWELRCTVERAVHDLKNKENMADNDLKTAFHNKLNLAMDYLNTNDKKGSHKHLKSTYQKTKGDKDLFEENLSSLEGLISLVDPKTDEDRDKIIELSKEGIEIAQNNKDKRFECLFIARCLESTYYSLFQKFINDRLLLEYDLIQKKYIINNVVFY